MKILDLYSGFTTVFSFTLLRSPMGLLLGFVSGQCDAAGSDRNRSLTLRPNVKLEDDACMEGIRVCAQEYFSCCTVD